MELWLIGLLHFIASLFYFNAPAMDTLPIDISSIQVSSTIEDIFKAHCLSLACAASAYEQEHNPVAFAQLHKDMYQAQLVQLLQENQSQIKEICKTDEVEQAFKQAYQKTKAHVKTDERVACWKTFIHRLYEKQDTIRKEKLPGVWFPTQQDASNEKAFIKKNAEIALEGMQWNYFVVSEVITFLPFALIEQYDKEAFKVFFAARHVTQK